MVRIVCLDIGAIFTVGNAPNRIGFGEQAAGIQGKYVYGKVVRKNIMGDHLVFHAKAGGKRDLAGKLGDKQVQRIYYRQPCNPG